MAQRPIFLPSSESKELVSEISLKITWHSGFAPVQKAKNICELHSAAKANGFGPILEVSTKSADEVGRRLSSFNLKVSLGATWLPLEVAFQGSKVFEHAGPFTDLFRAEPREAKRDERLRHSGRLIAFRFNNVEFPVMPVTAFYDWLYLSAIYPHREWLTKLEKYSGFSDIEFNPEKSVNCQARSCALFFSLLRKGLLDEAMSEPSNFIRVIEQFSYMRVLPSNHGVSVSNSATEQACLAM